MEGARPSSPPASLSPLWLHLCVRSNPKPIQMYVKRAVHYAHFNMNRAFKVIQGHPYWCRQESRTVCCRNVPLMPTLFLKRTKIWQRENGKFVDFNDRPHAGLKTSQQETPSNIYKWFILPETTVISSDLLASVRDMSPRIPVVGTISPICCQVKAIYTVFQKTGTLFVFAITLSTASQFA